MLPIIVFTVAIIVFMVKKKEHIDVRESENPLRFRRSADNVYKVQDLLLIIIGCVVLGIGIGAGISENLNVNITYLMVSVQGLLITKAVVIPYHWKTKNIITGHIIYIVLMLLIWLLFFAWRPDILLLNFTSLKGYAIMVGVSIVVSLITRIAGVNEEE